MTVEYDIENLNQTLTATLVNSHANGSLTVSINGKEKELNIVSLDANHFDFILDNKFHTSKILESLSSHVKLLIDGQIVSIKKHTKLAEILGKSLLLGDKASGENRLTSQIPGRVVAVVATVGSEVKKGDSVAVLESMKMQVAIKAHKDGKIKEIKVKESAIVSRNDIVAIIE
jgi:biotin carboxyl carrier protein